MHSCSVWWSDNAYPGLFIQACADTGGPPQAHLRLVGEIDLAARTLLTEAATWTAESTPERVLIDLEGVTFAGSILAKFVTRLCERLPRAEVILWRAQPAVDLVLRGTGLHLITRVSTDPIVPAAFVCRRAQ